MLVVSTIQLHKNYLRLLEAIEKICNESDFGYDLVVAGPIGDQSEFMRMEKLINQPSLSERTILGSSK
jgi:glycosyltransferase involved in cell wall biosynthesis